MKIFRENPLALCVLCLLLVSLAAVVFAAQERTPTSPIRVNAGGITFKSEMNGALTSAIFEAVIQRVDVLPNGEAHIETLGKVAFDLAKDPGEVVVSGNKRTYNQLAHALYQAALQEWADTMRTPVQSPPPLPALENERKLLRNAPQVP